MGEPPFRRTGDGIVLFVRLTPRSSKEAVEGWEAAGAGPPHIRARVRAVPEKGLANAALVRLVAKWLGVAPGTVEVAAGATSRLKQLRISGDPESLALLLLARLSPEP
ncbi:MAG: DUF167 family protein [Phyllobacterium sp.]